MKFAPAGAAKVVAEIDPAAEVGAMDGWGNAPSIVDGRCSTSRPTGDTEPEDRSAPACHWPISTGLSDTRRCS